MVLNDKPLAKVAKLALNSRFTGEMWFSLTGKKTRYMFLMKILFNMVNNLSIVKARIKQTGSVFSTGVFT